MKRALAISVIALVAVVMGLSTIAPALQQAFAHDVAPDRGEAGLCPADFRLIPQFSPGTHPDHNANGWVCLKSICAPPVVEGPCRASPLVFVDDNLIR